MMRKFYWMVIVVMGLVCVVGCGGPQNETSSSEAYLFDEKYLKGTIALFSYNNTISGLVTIKFNNDYHGSMMFNTRDQRNEFGKNNLGDTIYFKVKKYTSNGNQYVLATAITKKVSNSSLIENNPSLERLNGLQAYLGYFHLAGMYAHHNSGSPIHTKFHKVSKNVSQDGVPAGYTRTNLSSGTINYGDYLIPNDLDIVIDATNTMKIGDLAAVSNFTNGLYFLYYTDQSNNKIVTEMSYLHQHAGG